MHLLQSNLVDIVLQVNLIVLAYVTNTTIQYSDGFAEIGILIHSYHISFSNKK